MAVPDLLSPSPSSANSVMTLSLPVKGAALVAGAGAGVALGTAAATAAGIGGFFGIAKVKFGFGVSFLPSGVCVREAGVMTIAGGNAGMGRIGAAPAVARVTVGLGEFDAEADPGRMAKPTPPALGAFVGLNGGVPGCEDEGILWIG